MFNTKFDFPKMNVFHQIRHKERMIKNIEKGYIESWKPKQKERLKIKIRMLKLFPIGVDLIIVDYVLEVIESFECHGCRTMCELKIGQSISCRCGRKYCHECQVEANDENFFSSDNCPTNPSGWVLIDDCDACEFGSERYPSQINTQIYFKLV